LLFLVAVGSDAIALRCALLIALAPHLAVLTNKTLLITNTEMASSDGSQGGGDGEEHVEFTVEAEEDLYFTGSKTENPTRRVTAGTPYTCLMPKTQSLPSLFHRYAKHHGLQTDDLEYHFSGNPLENEDTPGSVQIQRGDIIMVRKKRKPHPAEDDEEFYKEMKELRQHQEDTDKQKASCRSCLYTGVTTCLGLSGYFLYLAMEEEGSGQTPWRGSSSRHRGTGPSSHESSQMRGKSKPVPILTPQSISKNRSSSLQSSLKKFMNGTPAPKKNRPFLFAFSAVWAAAGAYRFYLN